MIAEATKTRKPYDPGTAKEIKWTGGDLYSVESFRNAGVSYRVDTKAETCDCPAFSKKHTCKHLSAVSSHISNLYQRALTVCQSLSDDQLLMAGMNHRLHPVQLEAVEMEAYSRMVDVEIGFKKAA